MTFFKRNKFGAVRTNGMASKLEAAVYDILKQREFTGAISELQCQKPIVLQGGSQKTKISWRVDFTFIEDGKRAWAEAKGKETEAYLLKLKMFRANPQGVLYIYKGSYQRPFIAEVIEP